VQTLTGSFTFPPGGTIVLTGGLGGTRYLWYRDGTRVADTRDTDRITGAETAQLIIKGAQPSEGGRYELIAFGGLDSQRRLTNAVYEVRVADVPPSLPPFINNFFYQIGPDYIAFKVEAGGSAPLHYQWTWQGEDIPGATGDTLAYTNAASTANAGYYAVRVWNDYGQVSSPPPGLLFTKPVPAGTYQGIFFDTNNPSPETSGSFQYSLSASRRSYSGKVTMGKTTYRFSGSFSEAHDSLVTSLPGRDGKTLTLALQLVTTEGLGRIKGWVSTDEWVVPLQGNRIGFTSESPALQAGKYTLALQHAETNFISTVPDGNSWACVLVATSGRVTLQGEAADGKPLRFTTALSRNAEFPLYCTLYGNAGVMLGWLSFTNAADSSIPGQVYWAKGSVPGTPYPYGFSVRLRSVGSRFITTVNSKWPDVVIDVIPFSAGVASFTGGDMYSSDLAVWDFVPVKVPAANTFNADAGPEKLRLNVSKATGSLSGSFVNYMTGLRTRIRGVILQEFGGGLGYFLSGDTSGYFALSASQ
jgi:hypothetical protein